MSLICSIGFARECQNPDCYSCSLEEKIPKDNMRFKTFLYALNLMKERHAQILVETGTARCGKSNCIGDGCSTFSDWTKHHLKATKLLRCHPSHNFAEWFAKQRK